MDSVNWLALIDDLEDSFNARVEYWGRADIEEMVELYHHLLKELSAVKNSPIALRDEDYRKLRNLYKEVQEDGVWEQVFTDVLLPLKEITDHIKEDLM